VPIISLGNTPALEQYPTCKDLDRLFFSVLSWSLLLLGGEISQLGKTKFQKMKKQRKNKYK
jgi:hypothetical protein